MYLKLPMAGYRDYSTADLKYQSSYGNYWSSSPAGSYYPNYACHLSMDAFNVNANASDRRASGFSVRCFKNSYVAQDSSWTVIY